MKRIEHTVELLKKVVGDRPVTIFAGVGEPIIAAGKFKQINPGNVTICLESGLYDMPVGTIPETVGSADILEYCFRSNGLEVLSRIMHKSVDVSIIGCAQVDLKGNVNSTLVSENKHLSGSGGSNDFFKGAKIRIVIVNDEDRKLVEQVEYKTSINADYIVTDNRTIEVKKS